MAKEWSEFWRRSNAPDYEGMAGGEHQTMIRRANELHGELQPIEWKKFKATDIYQKEVFGTYRGERIAVDRLDYDAYVVNRYDGPEDLTADQKDRMTQEYGLYDYGHYGSYNEKKQLDTDMQDDKSTDTYMDHSNSLYKEKAMNENQNTDHSTYNDDHMEPDSTDMGSDTLNMHIDANDAVSGDIDHSIRPSHYESSNPDVPAIQMWDYALSQNLGFFEGNIIKYVSRWKQKGGVQDLQKALTYLQRLMDSQASPKP